MLKIDGKLIKNLAVTRGESERGTWARGGFVIESFGDYPKTVAFTTFGEERVKMTEGMTAGTPVEVRFLPESREFNGKWYTECKAIDVKPIA